MTGSDQVWNTFYNHGIDKLFYLDFAPEHKKRVAYAASFGMSEIDSQYKEETKRLLSKYSVISVRESSAIDLLKSIGINNGVHVLDPTFLLSKEDWKQVVGRYLPQKKEKYLLIYSVEPNFQNVIACARKIADKLDLKVYYAGWGIKKYIGVDKMLGIPDPLSMMGYFINADFVVASSFHGTAFSVNLNKQFISVEPEKFNSRVHSLLESLGLMDRLVKTPMDIDTLEIRGIDYYLVNQKLNFQKEASKEF